MSSRHGGSVCGQMNRHSSRPSSRARGAKRTIDFKAGPFCQSRPVFAEDSQTLLRSSVSPSFHCLGLALFLARAQHEGSGFIVLDDPVLSSDDDYRVHFNFDSP